MKSNPITALSDLFGKLVIEHGSAVVQEKHIALLKEQFSIFERENTKLTTRLEKSESKNDIFKAENKNLKNEIIQLKKKIETYEKSTHEILLDDEQIAILQYLASVRHDYVYSTSEIVSVCNIPVQSALYYLEDLEDKYMVESEEQDNESWWMLAHKGRGYLVKNKLLSQQGHQPDSQ